VDCVTPRVTLELLLHGNDNKTMEPSHWEAWRDGLVRKWTNLNIVNGLVIGAVSTLLFGSYTFSGGAFAFGVASLLSSLICIGFGVGLIYVLGDVSGHTLRLIALRYPTLFLIALSIPQSWGGISFATFFITTCIIGFQANKGPYLIFGLCLTIFLLGLHIIGFIILFRKNIHDGALCVPEPEFDGEKGPANGPTNPSGPTQNTAPTTAPSAAISVGVSTMNVSSTGAAVASAASAITTATATATATGVTSNGGHGRIASRSSTGDNGLAIGMSSAAVAPGPADSAVTLVAAAASSVDLVGSTSSVQGIQAQLPQAVGTLTLNEPPCEDSTTNEGMTTAAVIIRQTTAGDAA